jgi:NADH-quinone oxidoreductase subunit E
MTQEFAEAIREIVAAHPGGREMLIPVLQEVQAGFGYLSRESVSEIGRQLGLPASKIYGVATFYNQFRFQPLGRFHIQVCRGTACHVKGSSNLLDSIRRKLSLEPGRTSRDGMFSLEVVACLGACALAPVMTINGEFHARVTPGDAGKLIDACAVSSEVE